MREPKRHKTKGMKRSEDEAVDTTKDQDQPKQKRPTTQVHNMTAMITATRLIQAKKGNVRTHLQGQIADMTDEQRKWILIAEISDTQSPHHYSLVQQVMYHVCVL